MRLDELLHNLVFGAHRAERVSICPRVVGHQSFDPIDAVHSEVGDSASEESRTCDTCLVIMNLGLRQTGMVIDHRVDVVETDCGGTLFAGRASGSPVRSPTTTVGYAPEFLDIHVHKFARSLAFVADSRGFGGSDSRAGERIEFTQIWHAVSTEYSRHGACRHTELGADPVLATSIFTSGFEDPVLDLVVGACRHRVRA